MKEVGQDQWGGIKRLIQESEKRTITRIDPDEPIDYSEMVREAQRQSARRAKLCQDIEEAKASMQRYISEGILTDPKHPGHVIRKRPLKERIARRWLNFRWSLAEWITGCSLQASEY